MHRSLMRPTEEGEGDDDGLVEVETVGVFFWPTFMILRTMATITPTTISRNRNMMNLQNTEEGSAAGGHQVQQDHRQPLVVIAAPWLIMMQLFDHHGSHIANV